MGESIADRWCDVETPESAATPGCGATLSTPPQDHADVVCGESGPPSEPCGEEGGEPLTLLDCFAGVAVVLGTLLGIALPFVLALLCLLLGGCGSPMTLGAAYEDHGGNRYEGYASFTLPTKGGLSK